MNIIEKEAKAFGKNWTRGRSYTIENLKECLDDKISVFNDRNSLVFLRVLRAEISNELQNHQPCTISNCATEKLCNNALFVIDQEMERINGFYEFEVEEKEKFTSEEESELYVLLNKVLEEIKDLKNGQILSAEVLFEEIESLKEHFNMGKKNWFQFALGKLMSLTAEKVIDETIAKSIYQSIAKDFEEYSNQYLVN